MNLAGENFSVDNHLSKKEILLGYWALAVKSVAVDADCLEHFAPILNSSAFKFQSSPSAHRRMCEALGIETKRDDSLAIQKVVPTLARQLRESGHYIYFFPSVVTCASSEGCVAENGVDLVEAYVEGDVFAVWSELLENGWETILHVDRFDWSENWTTAPPLYQASTGLVMHLHRRLFPSGVGLRQNIEVANGKRARGSGVVPQELSPTMSLALAIYRHCVEAETFADTRINIKVIHQLAQFCDQYYGQIHWVDLRAAFVLEGLQFEYDTLGYQVMQLQGCQWPNVEESEVVLNHWDECIARLISKDILRFEHCLYPCNREQILEPMEAAA